MKQLKTIILLIVIALPVQAADFIAEAGYHSGGDTLATGSSASSGTETMEAGDGYSFAAGMAFEVNNTTDLLVSFGMKKDVIYPDNGTVTFVRYPLNISMLFISDKWRYGFGITAHMNPQFKEETSTNQTVGYDNAIGYILDVRYVLFDNVYIAGRYTSIEYEITNDPDSTSVDGSSVGLLVGIQL